MPRSTSSAAERQLLARLGEAGFSTTSSALERWRSAGVAVRLPRRALGRGKGSTSWLDENTFEQTLAAAAAVRRTRSLAVAVLVLFLDGHDVSEQAVRDAYAKVIDKVLASAEGEALPGESRMDTFDRWARRAVSRGAPPNIRRARKRLKHQRRHATNAELLHTQASALLGGQIDEEAAKTIILGSGVDLTIIDDLDASARELADFMRELNLHELRRVATETPWEELRRARDLLNRLEAFARDLRAPAAAHGKPDAMGLTEVELMEGVGSVFAVLGAVQMLRRFPVEVDAFDQVMEDQAPQLQALTSLLVALGEPQMLPDPETFMAALPDGERDRLHALMQRWSETYPELAARLLSERPERLRAAAAATDGGGSGE